MQQGSGLKIEKEYYFWTPSLLCGFIYNLHIWTYAGGFFRIEDNVHLNISIFGFLLSFLIRELMNRFGEVVGLFPIFPDLLAEN